MKEMFPDTNQIFIVVLPLIITNIEDQIQETSKLGITAMQISVTSDIQQGRWQLVFSSHNLFSAVRSPDLAERSSFTPKILDMPKGI